MSWRPPGRAQRRGPGRWAALVLLAALVLANPVTQGAGPPWEEARRLVRAGRHKAAHRALTEALARPGLPAEDEAQLRLALARFFVEEVDYFDEARRQLERVSGLGPGAPSELRTRARSELDRLDALEQRWAKENELLRSSRVLLPWKTEDLTRQIRELRRLITNRPDYPHRARAYYYLGNSLLTAREYGPARAMLLRARALRPALDFSLPVSARLREAHNEWLRRIVSGAAWTGLVLVGLLALALLLRARPWAHLGLRELLLLAGLTATWGPIFLALTHLLGPAAPAPPDGVFGLPLYSSGAPDSPGAEAVDLLLWVGFAGVAITLSMVVGTARAKLRWTTGLLNATTALVAFCSLLALFYLRRIDDSAAHFEEGDGPLPLVSGTTYVPQSDVEPYLLTDPIAYPKLDIDNLDEVEMREWIRARQAAAPASPEERR